MPAKKVAKKPVKKTTKPARKPVAKKPVKKTPKASVKTVKVAPRKMTKKPTKKPVKKVVKKTAASKKKQPAKKQLVKLPKVSLPKKITWRQANWVLITLIILVNGYIFGLPLMPRLNYLWRESTNHNAGIPYQSNLAASSSLPNAQRGGIPQDDRVVIPKIFLDQPILQGTSPYTVNKGVWARPNASTPPKGGNTVLVGHRYTYSGPSVFYDLDKVAVGDKVIVYWQGKEYDYQVRSTRVVAATETAVESPTKEAELTIYTCTPLWSFTERLVIVSDLIKESK